MALAHNFRKFYSTESCYLVHSLTCLIDFKGMEIRTGTVVFKIFYDTVGWPILMGEGFILLTKIYKFIRRGLPPPFDTLNICTCTHGMR